MMQNNNVPKTKQIKLISKGSYGCIMHPGPVCKGMKNDDYITKIQKLTSISAHETAISKKIKGIKFYSKYFAPIIETCDVTLSTIDKDELKKCDVLESDDDTKKQYESNIIKYVGKNTLADYFEDKMGPTNDDTNFFANTFINSHLILLEAIKRLFMAGIIHYDLKNNNVMCQDNDGRPIIIDFGMSIDIAQMKYEESFHIYGPQYAPWCIDICFLTYMSSKVGKDWQNKTVTMLEMEKVVNEFMSKNTAIVELTDAQEKTMFKQKILAYFKQFDRSTWKAVLDELLKWKATWDNYSLAVVYLQFFKELNLDHYANDYEHIGAYKKLLKQILLSLPNERLTPDNTIKQINALFSSVPRVANRKFKNQFKADIKTVDNYQNRKQQLAMARWRELQSEV